MKRRTFIKHTGAAGLIAFITPSDVIQSFHADSSTLEQHFINPPHSALTQTYWFWMNGNVTREGITLDLEAMKKVGVGGVFNFDVGTGIPKGPVVYLSKEWLELKKHAMREAARLGLEFTMHNCPGWSSSGGPWITPELAMQQLTWSETYVAGGGQVNTPLPKPLVRLNHYRDLAVLAFPSLEGEDLMQSVKLSSPAGPIDKEKLSGDGATVRPAGNDNAAWLQFEFARPFEARMITFFISAPEEGSMEGKPLEFGERTSIRLEASDDGVQYRLVTAINTGLNTELAISDKYIVYDIPATTAKYFRIVSSKTRRYRQVQFSGITRLKNWMEKTNTRARNFVLVEESSGIVSGYTQQVPRGSVIDLKNIIDISQYAKDGVLKWDAPAGNWTILRIGYTPTGTLNRAAPDTGIGLECDKYNPKAISFHFNKMTEHLLPELKMLAAKGKAGLSIDSYEAGTQNWTEGFEKIFLQRWKYDIIRYLPALTGGRVIDSVETTERFLWNLRKVQSELIAGNYYGKFHQLCRQHNITSYIEPYDSGPMEEMQIGSKVNTNLGEFWNGISSLSPIKNPAFRTVKLAASIAHINGQRVTGAEAFTAEPDSSKWQEYPFALKALGDKFFTQGTNRLVIHRYAHQPHPSALPGMTMGPWGIHFDRTNTLWEPGRAWLRYLARCQSMLQQGRFVADLVYFAGEDANMYTKARPEDLHPSPPKGYDYDLINAEVILKDAKVINNNVVLPNGMSYRVFVLQDYKIITIELLRKLQSMLKEGMILIGQKPELAAGLSGTDDEFSRTVNEIWGNADGNTITDRQYGKGHVYWGQPLTTILEKLKIDPDFDYTSRSGDAGLRYIHRKTADADIYFISNQRRSVENLVCTFRVLGRQPELWDADNGKIIPIGIYSLAGDRVRLPMRLDEYGSIFVVFRKPAANRWQHIRRDNITLSQTKDHTPATAAVSDNYKDTFSVAFNAKPEINALLNPDFIMGTIRKPWTDYYALYPPSGHAIHGNGHAIMGVTVGRNGVGVWEHTAGDPVLVLAAPVSISGWAHIAIVYNKGVPSVYVNGQLTGKGKKSESIVHPPPAKALHQDGMSFYNGDMNTRFTFDHALTEDDIRKMANVPPPAVAGILKAGPESVEAASSGGKPALLLKVNGLYTLQNHRGEETRFIVAGIEQPLVLTGPWQVHFPAGSGAPGSITLPGLISLHTHADNGVKYFSGTASYTIDFSIDKSSLDARRWTLDLGSVEATAEVLVNGRNMGILWKRPYSMDVTEALRAGVNNLQIKVTNQWPNRLIGDEQLPDPDKFTPGGGASGMQGVIGGTIEKLPDWYMHGKPKPDNGRVTFTTWKHYSKDSPLMLSGLIGPVSLQSGFLRLL